MIKKVLAASVAASLSVAAHAALVTQWSADVTSEFLPGTVDWRSGTTGGRSATADQVQWGPSGGPADLADPDSDRSGVKITGNPAIGVVVDTFIGTPVPPGDFVPPYVGLTQVFTHYNRVLSSVYSTLESIQVRTTLTLTPLNPPAGALPTEQAVFTVDFLETPNNPPGSPGTCADGSSEGAPQNQPDGCGDIFVLAGNLDAATINYDGETYYVQIFETTGSLIPLSNTACAAAGAANGCRGFITRENQATPVQFAFLISSEPFNGGVPEPSSIALLGLGLGAVGYFVRRRRQVA